MNKILIYHEISTDSGRIQDFLKYLDAEKISKNFINDIPRKFSKSIKSAKYLIIDDIMDENDINSLNKGNMKSLVHGEYYDFKSDEFLKDKTLIIFTTCKKENIFTRELALRKRIKFISLKNDRISQE